ncbi:PTS mannitol transporter subunit IICB [Erwinia sp. JUb26]|uniref:PTS mannitol transporter subunit IICB n=1 Tax=Erwinia sp. JUb26 TaxID=2485126 RepID=UPI000F48723D|nr:PTS mannitol transporter subunit IICB [Erwinia sp. JUb26]ROR09836.1 PTS system D-mannitol-specific IIB component (Fru family) /PTS system D-mannitol-specific IIC component (Fru family) [Erwinia sp. JUb26]
MKNISIRARMQSFGGFLTAMVIPNIGAFMAWGFITALFIPAGWFPNKEFGSLVEPMIRYMLPMLVGYTGGQMVGGKRGAVIGTVGTMGVIVGTNVPMLLGAMAMGPLGGLVSKQIDRLLEDRIPAGLENVVQNFALGIAGMVLALLGYEFIGPFMLGITNGIAFAIDGLLKTGYLPTLALLIEPTRVLFLNNAIDQAIFYQLGMKDAAVNGSSIFFMVFASPGPGLGLLLAFCIFGKGMAKKSAPAATIIHIFGGIHEMYFPYVYMKPLMILPLMLGSAVGIEVFSLMHAGLVAGATPGSIFAFMALTPPGKFLATLSGIGAAAIVTFIGASIVLKFDRSTEDSDSFVSSQDQMKSTKEAGMSEAYAAAKRESQGLAGVSDSMTAVNVSSVRFIAFACDAGAGSSAMGATTFRKKLQKAGLDEGITVRHFAIESIPDHADLVVVHQNLADRVRMSKNVPVIEIKNYLGDPKLETLLQELREQKASGAAPQLSDV